MCLSGLGTGVRTLYILLNCNNGLYPAMKPYLAIDLCQSADSFVYYELVIIRGVILCRNGMQV